MNYQNPSLNYYGFNLIHRKLWFTCRMNKPSLFFRRSHLPFQAKELRKPIFLGFPSNNYTQLQTNQSCVRIKMHLCNSTTTKELLTDTTIEARPVFPFTAIVGQEEMKLALILNVIDPKIGGVMIMGDRGTGKSTTVRALVDLLPEIEVVLDDPFNSDPSDLEVMSKEVREKIKKNEMLNNECLELVF